MKIIEATNSKLTNYTELNPIGFKEFPHQITHTDLPQGGTFDFLPR
jgi:hypothetical protein